MSDPTPEERQRRIIEAVRAWQVRGDVHPLTCGTDSLHENLVAVPWGEDVVLRCPDCPYTQTHIPSFVTLTLTPPEPTE